MSYQYPVTGDEQAAADLLKARGWDLQPPRCPECKGWGFIYESKGDPSFGGATLTSIPCPRGCETTAWYL